MPLGILCGKVSASCTRIFIPAVAAQSRLVGTYESAHGRRWWLSSVALRRGLELLERTHDRYPYDKILSHQYPLAQISEAFAHAAQGKAIRTALICAPELVVRSYGASRERP